MAPSSKKRVAIVGSGSGGMGALYALRNTGHEVHLFEADDRLGGHTNTVTYTKNGKSVPVDTGFFVLNTATYPNFIAMLSHLKVPTIDTVMTFSVSRDRGAYEWSGSNLGAVFAQRRNILNPRTWRMILDIIRFNLTAIELLSQETEATTSLTKLTAQPVRELQETLGSYLARNKYSDAFIDDYLLPMTAAVWSTPPDKCALEFPAVTLVRFMWNHHLLSTFSARPPWLTIKGGSSTYIQAILKYFPEAKIHLDSPVESVTPFVNGSNKVLLDLGSKGVQEFDHVILATHGDQARKIIGGNATKAEAKILDCFTTTTNEAVLHGDINLMPHRPLAYAAWNILSISGRSRTEGHQEHQAKSASQSQSLGSTSSSTTPFRSRDQIVSLTYDMSLLQSLPKSLGPVLVTLNPPFSPSPSLIQGRFKYAHPLYTPAAIHAQSLLPSIQGTRGVSYAGAWTRYGFHEDGFSSGVKVAMDALGGSMGSGSGTGKGEWVDATFIRGRDEGGPQARIKRRFGLLILDTIEAVLFVVWLPWRIVGIILVLWLRILAGVFGILRGKAHRQ